MPMISASGMPSRTVARATTRGRRRGCRDGVVGGALAVPRAAPVEPARGPTAKSSAPARKPIAAGSEAAVGEGLVEQLERGDREQDAAGEGEQRARSAGATVGRTSRASAPMKAALPATSPQPMRQIATDRPSSPARYGCRRRASAIPTPGDQSMSSAADRTGPFAQPRRTRPGEAGRRAPPPLYRHGRRARARSAGCAIPRRRVSSHYVVFEDGRIGAAGRRGPPRLARRRGRSGRARPTSMPARSASRSSIPATISATGRFPTRRSRR